MWKWLWGRFAAREREVVPSPPSVLETTQEDPSIEPALELERRLYESAVSGLEQTIAKEGLVGTFLTSGAIVTFGYSVQALAQLAPQVGKRTVILGTILCCCAFVCLFISGIFFLQVLKGQRVRDVSEGIGFMNKGFIPTNRQEARLKLMKEYRNARRRHEILIRRRMKGLLLVLTFLCVSIFFSPLAVFSALTSLAIHKTPMQDRTPKKSGPSPMLISARGPYNINMPRPPIKLPQPGPGTIMIKGGGGNGK